MRNALQAGFTLIELVVVIVILGILAAVAVPQFVDLADDARAAVVEGGCGAAQSAAVLAYASQRGPVTSASIEALITVSGDITVDVTACVVEVTPPGATVATQCNGGAAISPVICTP